ncbi:4-hydroxy-tetrahydrodipicolinate synthase [Chlamydia pecorum]|uniref:4-hydroxy-tetrahydrodipicolinate synthase n=2 Tax=Chlamydia pecorum TaxID=85991 RepID=A0AA34RE21_CHLPE|nr:4-hydroxy-tetrahydrodipicolinate synthase [Chlamydia pecorum]AEB42006.1 dihydrodipicolinate synthase [Chlamydia pecorum E58]AGW38162.1 dihydrodipicolinate synthase [Chlamydia pecorum PV3056/3]AGW39085.1 dihydrodipicolinate synthase [Chlamydia pecorum W73]AGW40011.1 dihydrodipicolinate synthase [Chlamydia pecorum P787]ETF37741.1 dihydrodipicolinate synthase [Chlamydia pecorum VR629]
MRMLAAVVTPFFPDFRIDFASLGRILRLQEEANNGIVLLGSTGESLSLSLEEKLQVLRFACDLHMHSPLYIGIPGVSLQDSLAWMDMCHGYPISGFLLTSPIYTKPGVYGQTLWFETLLKKTQLPAILYNIPSRAGTPLHIDTLKAVAHYEFCWGVKDSGGSIENGLCYQQCAPHLKLFCGDDGLWHDMASHGAYGLISVAANAWAKEVHEVVHSFFPKELWQELTSWLAQATNPISIKHMLAHLGYISSPTLRVPLSDKDFSQQGSLPTIVEKMLCRT